jgi:hypothetical protein
MVLGYMQTQNHHISMAIDWTEIYQKHKGRWIALEDDEQTVMGSGDSACEALDAAQENGCEQPIVTRQPQKLIPFVAVYKIEHVCRQPLTNKPRRK